MESHLIAQTRLHERLSYDVETGLFSWKTHPPRGRPRKDGSVGSPNSQGYLRVNLEGRSYLLHRLAWLYVHGRWPENDLDHINGIPQDNRIANLREATRSQNMANARTAANNTSGFKGVSKRGDKWVAYMGRNNFIGEFADKEAAILARREAAEKKYGEFVRH